MLFIIAFKSNFENLVILEDGPYFIKVLTDITTANQQVRTGTGCSTHRMMVLLDALKTIPLA